MKIRNLSALFVFLAGPIALLASSGTDRKIEDAAKASYNFRTVLDDRVTANEAEKTLVGRLALGIRGAKSVDNNMTVKSDKGLTSN